MLTEGALTNTLTLSGISNIRYRVYTQSYKKNQLFSYLTCKDFAVKSSSYAQNEKLEILLIKAFRHLLDLNIPSSWHTTPSSDNDLIELELWVFWFDDRHTRIIDNGFLLNDLKEVKVGSFNWDQLNSSGLSPTASPQLGANSGRIAASLTSGNEYRLFIKSIRNLVHTTMIKRRNAFSLGEFYIYPGTYKKEDEDIIDTLTDGSKTAMPPQNNTMVACMYNIYLTSSNLVFQPNARRMRIRPLTHEDKYVNNKKVLLCPSGEHAALISFKSLPTLDLQEKNLHQWAEFYHLPPTRLYSSDENIPPLVTIRTASDNIITYPSMLLFVPTDTKLTPSAVSGLNGIMGLSHGLTEDLGTKASRFEYHERLKSTGGIIDYSSYRDPMIYSGNFVINALSMSDTNYQQDQLLLHRALLEPVIPSPIMSLKSVIPINTTLLLGSNNVATTKISHSQHSTPPKPSLNINMNLVEFAAAQFQAANDEPVEALLDRLNPLNDPNIAMSKESSDVQSGGRGGSQLSSMMRKNLTIEPYVQQQSNIVEQSQQEEIIEEDEETVQVPVDDFMYDIDAITRNNADPWDTNEDFGDLDLDVTEADFDFFKTTAPAPASAVLTPSNVLGVIPMDIVPVKEEQMSTASYLQQQQQHNGAPLIVEKSASLHVNEESVEVTEPTPNNDSLFTPFVISNNSTEDVSMESSNITSVDPTTTSTPTINCLQPMTSSIQKRIPYQKFAPEPSTFVPRDFLPVSINTNAIDAKYSTGGKFMYDPSIAEKDQTTKHNLKREFYSPDYVPAVKKKIVKRKLIIEQKVDNEVKKIPSPEDIKIIEAFPREEEIDSIFSGNSSSSSSISSGSSSSGSHASGDSDDGDDSSDDSLSTDQAINKRIKTIKKYQRSIVYSLLKATPAPQPTDIYQRLDYDTPFAPILANGDIKPIKWRQSKAMEQSMEYLCQQAIWGGYPFAGGLAEVSQNGGEVEGELAKVLAARRSNMMQMTRGVVTHVPCLQTDTHKLTMEFKSMLRQLFVLSSSETIANKATENEEMALEARSYLTAPLLGSVDIKGPLNIQQYCDLGENQNQAHSKYGKYQIKKKRPDEPNLDTLKKPDIVVSRYEDFLEGSPTMIPFWEKLGLEPYSNKKQVKYLVIYPENADIEISVRQFFQSLSTVYDVCHLGRHDAAGQIGHYHHGLVPVPLAASEKENETSVKQRLIRYEETCENLGRFLAGEDHSNSQNLFYTVIYMVNPGPHMSSYLDMCRCFYRLKEEYNKISGEGNQSNRIVLQLIPIDHILRSSAFGGYTMMGMKDIVFSVYTKCLSVISRKANPLITTDLYAPPFILTKPIQKKIQFKLDDIRPFPIILDQNASLHLAYCFSYDRSWMSVVWIDGRGELLEYALFSRKTAFKEAWERTIEIAKRTDFSWTIVITKIELMFNEELVHWSKYISSNNKNKYWVAIVGLDFESGLNLHFNACFPATIKPENNSQQQTPTMLDSFGRSVSVAVQQLKQQKHQQDNKNIASEAQILLLNHRISYSQKRVRAFKGMLRTEAISEKENWMTPLATGYLVHHSLPNKNVNPFMEQLNNELFTVEIHLVYNHTPHSAYSTLQDIIKMLYALSFVNPVPSSHNCLPFHVALAERLSRLLLIVDD